MTIIKKTVLSVVTLGASLGIISTASAKEIPAPILPIQSNTTIENTSVITPYNLQKPCIETVYYSKTKYSIPAQIPSTRTVKVTDSAGTWVGTLTKKSVTESENGWKVVYSGTVTLQ